jgi:DNA invertase Pin-like site-specific DNA recombinase
LEKRGVNFVSLSDSEYGSWKTLFGMIAVFLEFEKNLIQERTRAGLEVARKKGYTGRQTTINPKPKESNYKAI